jgi:hypothetical protein
MDDRARDAAEAKLLLPLVQRFRDLLEKYDVRSEFWHSGLLGCGEIDAVPLPMLINSIEQRGRVWAYYRGITDDEVYRAFKDHDKQCRAATGTGDRCTNAAVHDGLRLSRFDPNGRRGGHARKALRIRSTEARLRWSPVPPLY